MMASRVIRPVCASRASSTSAVAVRSSCSPSERPRPAKPIMALPIGGVMVTRAAPARLSITDTILLFRPPRLCGNRCSVLRAPPLAQPIAVLGDLGDAIDDHVDALVAGEQDRMGDRDLLVGAHPLRDG